jgi:hypothetical protein
MTEYAPDTFTEGDVLHELEMAGLKFKVGHKYILSQCPNPDHDDQNASAQIYTNDWFVNCHATCGRFHITKAFPRLRESSRTASYDKRRQTTQLKRKEAQVSSHTVYNLMDDWLKMPLIPRDHEFKTIPLAVLDDLGWRWDEPKNAYFIPYFSRSKTSIPFAQWRNLSGDPRFRFLKDAKLTCYGTWNLQPGGTLFVVEGSSDAAVMEYCLMPWIALPSASSGVLLKQMAEWCRSNRVKLVYAGDNDAAGDKLKEALDEVMPYRVWQPPKKYKDWGDFLVGEGVDTVHAYLCREHNPDPDSTVEEEKTVAETVQELMSGGEIIEIVAPEEKHKEQSLGATQELF